MGRLLTPVCPSHKWAVPQVLALAANPVVVAARPMMDVLMAMMVLLLRMVASGSVGGLRCGCC